MKKIIAIIVLLLVVPKALGQEEYELHLMRKSDPYLSEQRIILHIKAMTQQYDFYVSMIKCPQAVIPLKVLYIIDGIPDSDESFKNLEPDDILYMKIIKYNEQYYYCGPPRDIVTIKTVNSVRKRELKKLRRRKSKELPVL